MIRLARRIQARRFRRLLALRLRAIWADRSGDAIAVIGDGSMSAGMAYEAMNNAGHLGKRMIVILNDNEMSIAPPVGAMSSYLAAFMPGSRFRN